METARDPFMHPQDPAEQEKKGVARFVSKVGRKLVQAEEFATIVFRNVLRDRVTIMASGLVYTTLMALVPCITFVFVFLGAFGVLQSVVNMLTQFFIDIFGEAAGQELVKMIETYTGNATSLGVIGIISFIITSLLLINKVWSVINQIYHTSVNRNPLRRFAGFLTFLVVGTLLLAAYFSVQSVMSNWYTRLMGLPAISGWLKVVQTVSPWIITWVGFFLIAFSVPNVKVRFSSALLGSFLGMLAVGILNYFYTWLTAKAVTYSVIYGSFAAIFLFLLYVYVIWMIVLSVIEVAYVHQYRPDKQQLRGLPQSPARQLTEGVNIMMLVGNNYKNGRGVTTTRELARRLMIPDRRLYGYLDLLTELHYIIPTNNGKTSFMPSRPLEDLKVHDLVDALYGFDGLAGDEEQDTPGEAVAAQIQGHGIDSLGELTIENLLERV